LTCAVLPGVTGVFSPGLLSKIARARKLLHCEQSFPATVVWLLTLCAGFTMSGLAAADYSLTLNPAPAHQDSSSPDDHPTKAFPGRLIEPFGTLGAANCFF
jgi:hypothetical protein